jgi:hypothetical protein
MKSEPIFSRICMLGQFLNLLKENEITGICVVNEEKINVYKILLGKVERKT